MSKRVTDLCTRLEISFANCESCGARAAVKLEDGSFWCEPCDESAKRLGYVGEDERPRQRCRKCGILDWLDTDDDPTCWNCTPKDWGSLSNDG